MEDIPESSGGAVHHSFDQSEELKSENNSNETSCARGEVDVEPQPEDELVRRRNAVLAATLRRLNQHS